MSKTFNSRNKGSTYERKVAKQMSDWWGGEFSRVPASGGLRWGADQRVAGDIVPPYGSNFPFVVECKKHEGWDLRHLMLNTGDIKKWWEQVVLDCRRMEKYSLAPFLIFSKNRDKDYVLVPYVEDVFNTLSESQPVVRTFVEFDNIRGDKQIFDVLLTTFEGISSLSQEYIVREFKDVKWDALNS